jgi:hypothetical protein
LNTINSKQIEKYEMDLTIDSEQVYSQFSNDDFDQLNCGFLNNFQEVDQHLIFSSNQQSSELSDLNEFFLESQPPSSDSLLKNSNITTQDESFVSLSDTCSPFTSVFSPFTDDELLLSPAPLTTNSWVNFFLHYICLFLII